MKKLNLKGKRFGRLVAIKETKKRDSRGYVVWLCKCDCGKEKTARSSHLLNKGIKSCGCLRKDVGKANIHYAIANVFKHGRSETRLHQIWRGMKQRCLNPKKNGYKNYGGRGIKVCQEWIESFSSFYSWAITNGYLKTLDIDRIDNDGNYEPFNCQWITKSENIRKRWSDQRLINDNS